MGSRTEDVDRLLAGVRAWVAGERAAQYRRDAGVWVVVDDPRPTPASLDVDRLVATAAACAPAEV